jgi:hypothetical protein
LRVLQAAAVSVYQARRVSKRAGRRSGRRRRTDLNGKLVASLRSSGSPDPELWMGYAVSDQREEKQRRRRRRRRRTFKQSS